MTLYKLKEIASQLNLTVKVLRIDLPQLQTLQMPCIIHWDMNHFMVIKSVTKSMIIVHDPAYGLRKLSLSQVEHSFTGIALEIKPNASFTPTLPIRGQAIKTLLHLLKHYRSLFIKLLMVSCLIQFFYILGIKIIQQCIDSSHGNLSYTNLLTLLLIAFIGTKIIEASSHSLKAFMSTKVGAFINRDFGLLVLRHLLILPNSFFENRHVADILSRFTAIEKIRVIVTDCLAESFVEILIALMIVTVMFFYNIKMTLIVLNASILYLICRLNYNIKAQQQQEEALHTRAIEVSHFMETIKSIPTIKIFSKEKDRLQSWYGKFICSLNATTKISWHKTLYDCIKNIVYGAELSINLFIGCSLLSNKVLTLGMLYAFLAYRQQFTTTVNGLVDKVHEYKMLKLHLDRIEDVISEPPELNNKTCSLHPIWPSTLELKNVSFSYAAEEPLILEKINLTINRGECIAITGASGCGKTTLLKIMMGLLAPISGNMTLDGIEIYPHHVSCYRKNIAAVLQDDVLFSGTINDNISFFDKDIDYEKVRRCANLAGIYDEINGFPMAFATLIGDMGSVLSGGQKQRVLLARALYTEPSILFLDEASSHLDNRKEIEINNSIKALGITIVLIAHRQETINMADRVIQLKK